jgi:hypothetical protein
MLHGIETVVRRDAFDFAAARSNRRILIDCSTSIALCKEFLGRADIDARLVRLVRHPCGYVDSELRRGPHLSLDEIFSEWERTNRQIGNFVANSGVVHTLACYDDLADSPEEHFPALCRFIGMPWESGALKYWHFPHHGLGGNGSNSLYLRGRKVVKFLTADDEFYKHLTASAGRRRPALSRTAPRGLSPPRGGTPIHPRVAGAAW